MKPFYTNDNGQLYFCDILAGLKAIPDKSVNCVITSPPYWQLRDYGFPDQWGLEPTFQEYLEHLWQMMDEIWRVLKDDGTVWINLGDTYQSAPVSGKQGGFSGKQARKNKEYGSTVNNVKKPQGQFKNKCLMLIPHRFAIGCIDRGWIMRNDIIWAKRNGMPESIRDRFSKKHEYIFFMVKQQKYYFDLDGIRDKTTTIETRTERIIYDSSKGDESNKTNTFIPPNPSGKNPGNVSDFWDKKPSTHNFPSHNNKSAYNKLGKNPGSVSDFWDIPTKPSSKKHYATYNFSLIDKCIIAGCPKGGTILDPFNGTGTTTLRAEQLERKWIGIDGSKEYSEIAKKSMKDEFNQIKLEF